MRKLNMNLLGYSCNLFAAALVLLINFSCSKKIDDKKAVNLSQNTDSSTTSGENSPTNSTEDTLLQTQEDDKKQNNTSLMPVRRIDNTAFQGAIHNHAYAAPGKAQGAEDIRIALCSAQAEAWVKEHKYQEAIWACLNEAQEDRAAILEAELEHILKTYNFDIEHRNLGGINANKVILKFHNSDVQAMFKPDGNLRDADRDANAHSEIAAYELSKLWDLRLVPLTVSRTINIPGTGQVSGSVHYFFQDARAGIRPNNNYAPTNLPNNSDFATMQIFDYIIGNSDRYNDHNWLHSGAHNNLIAIDHAFAFRKFFGGYENAHNIFIGGSLIPDPPPLGHQAKEILQAGMLYNFRQLPQRVKANLQRISRHTVRQQLRDLRHLEPVFVERMLDRLDVVKNFLAH